MNVSIPTEKEESIASPMNIEAATSGVLSSYLPTTASKGGAAGPVQAAVELSNQHFSMLDEMTEMFNVSSNNTNGLFAGTIAFAGGAPALASMNATLLTSSTHNNSNQSAASPINYYPNYAASGAVKYYDANFNWVGGVKGGALKVTAASATTTADAPAGAVQDEVVLAEAAHTRGVAERAVRYCYPTFLRTFHRMEWIGGKVSWLFGLESSRFQYAVDEYNRQKEMKAYRETMAAKHKQEVYLAKGLEGMDDPSDDVSDLPYLPTPHSSRFTV